jgi:RNA recognition motif-containing protein
MGEAAHYEETEIDNAVISNDAPLPSEPLKKGDPTESRYIPKETVYVGNLFFDVTAEDLKDRMSEYGVVLHSKIIHDSRGLSKG